MAPSNYGAISDENRTRYGTDIGRIGPMLLADRYHDRTHFIFELLQNAEDALGRRGEAGGPRSVTLTLTPGRLSLSHFGRPFDEADVRGICGIAESTKDQRSIGRFGIGFKSVYTFTDRPEIHSGDEDFAVENYVLPTAAGPLAREPGETQIILPLKSEDMSAEREIAEGFHQLGPGALLFLRHIDEINWSVEGGAAGVYLRSSPESLGPNVQRVTLIGQERDQPEVDQNWLVFYHDVVSAAQEKVGRVEVAFSLVPDKNSPDRWSVHPVAASPLVVYFPTVVSTNLGVLLQGPYRTTPSRDNIPRHDPWNQSLVEQTASLLVDALRWMRDNEMLNTSALRCLPIDRAKFPEGDMFAPVFDAVRQAFLNEALLPRFDGGFVSARQARMARTQDLRELFSAEQIESLFGAQGCAWLTADITQDKVPELRKYLLQELQVPEITPDQVVVRLSKEFLEAESDEWIAQLYAFLNGQKAISGRFSTIPLVRLDDGTHVVAGDTCRAHAFLPSAIETSFPTVRRAVCATSEARSFLISLGLTEPDPVDDVVWNVLPKYEATEVDGDDKAYAADIERVLTAFKTDSKAQRDKLLTALRETPFVMVVDTGDGKDYVSKPGEVYLATDRLKALFTGVPGVLVVDDNYQCLRGEAIRELLEACGALRCPRPVLVNSLTCDQRRDLRRQTGYEETSGQNDVVTDWELAGVEALLTLLPTLTQEQRGERARLLWDALGDLEERRGRGVFDGTYSWTHYGQRKAPPFPAAFLRRLNNTAWVPDASGDLVLPTLVTFESLGWRANPFLQSKIAFKPPIIDQLAREAGIEPAALDLLRKLGITSVADLARVGISIKVAAQDEADPDDSADTGTDMQAADDETEDGAPEKQAAHFESPGEAEPHEEQADGGADKQEDVESKKVDGTAAGDLGPAESSKLGNFSEPESSAVSSQERDDAEDKEEARGSGHVANVTRETRSTNHDERRTNRAARRGRRNLTGQAGLDEQATRLGRRVSSFFDGSPEVDDEETNTATGTSWRSRLVCLEVAAGGLQLEIGPLDGLPSFVKKLRVVGSENWDAFVLAANARLRQTSVSIRPGTGPWRWEAVGFEDEQDLGLDRLAFDALEVTAPTVFRVDADGLGQYVKSTTLALGQTYRLLLPPKMGDDLKTELDAGWRVWSLDLAEQQPSPTTLEVLKSLNLCVGEAWPRLEWALTSASAWRTTARGERYPAFDVGTELLVNLSGISIDESDPAMLFLHGPSGTERLPVSASGLVSLGAPSAGRWACRLLHSRTSVQPATLVFEVTKKASTHVCATWSVSMPRGLGSIEATAPPGWPITVRWGGLAAHEETIATLYGNDDRTVSFESIRPHLEDRAARAPVADIVVDFRELGRRLIPHDGRASLEQVREQLLALWQQRSGLIQSRQGMWLQLMPAWFEPTTTRLGYGVETLAMPTDVDAPHDLAAWLLTVDERLMGSITRAPSRVLVLTTNVDGVLCDLRAWIDSACAVAKVRDAVVTDGTRWTTHRKGDRQLKRREWNLDRNIDAGSLDDMLNDLTEGL